MTNKFEQIYKKNNDIWGNPQEYKSIKFYPLKISEESQINAFNKLFSYPKSATNDNPVFYKMSYLKFLIYVLPYLLDKNEEGLDFSEDLKTFLAYVTKIDIQDIEFSTRNPDDKIENLIISLFIGKDAEIFTESDFDIIREIILQQNGTSAEYIEAYRPELEKDLEFAMRHMEKYNFSDQIFAFAALFGKTMNEIKNCTLFQMRNLLDSVNAIEEYRMQTIPLTEVGKEYDVKHYMKNLKVKGRYSEILKTVDEFKEDTSYFNN